MNKETEQMLAELERIVVERQDWLFRFERLPTTA